MDRVALFEQGVATYARGDHYESHELWETLWQDESDDVKRDFLQALIQIASAVHKARHDVAPRGSLRLLDRAAERLATLGDSYLGIDLTTLRAGIARCRDEIARQLDATGHAALDARFVPAITQHAPIGSWHNSASPTVPLAAQSAWFARGLDAYAAGDYFEAHELWEEIWRDLPDNPERQFLQGLIQVAAAMHKAIAQRKPAPAARLLARALLRLREAPDGYRGLQVARLVAEADRARHTLAGLRDDTPLDPSLVPAIARRPS